MSKERDRLLRRYYREGKSRQEAMSLTGITNTNSMSSASGRLNLHWSWPKNARLTGIAPIGSTLEVKRSSPKVPNKKPDKTGGKANGVANRLTNAALKAQAPLVETESDKDKLVPVIVEPVEQEPTLAELAPHLYHPERYARDK